MRAAPKPQPPGRGTEPTPRPPPRPPRPRGHGGRCGGVACLALKSTPHPRRPVGPPPHPAPLATLDPGAFQNGPYRLRLTGADIAGRVGQAETTLEVRSSSKPERYSRPDTDFSATLAGQALDFTRRYDSEAADVEGSFGFG